MATSSTPKKIAFVASSAPAARRAMSSLSVQYGNVDFRDAEIVVALGGDGLMLQCLHRLLDKSTPIYGMNRGSVGFLMNEFREDELLERLEKAERSVIHPLLMVAEDVRGLRTQCFAINEVALLRSSAQAAKIRISVDAHMRMDQLICDGMIIATPAGSTAYNLSANGPILPLNAPLLALTPISAFRPRRWRGAILPQQAKVTLDIRESEKRPVNAVADNVEVKQIRRVDVSLAMDHTLVMLHDPGHSLDERILREQFDA